MAVSAQRLKLQGIVKDYPGCRANDGVDLTVGAGEIHALLGENGAGKSTLMKIIYGVVQPDAGRIVWNGHPVTVENPARARQLGIGMVFQHFSLFETLTVVENIALSLPPQDACTTITHVVPYANYSRELPGSPIKIGTCLLRKLPGFCHCEAQCRCR